MQVFGIFIERLRQTACSATHSLREWARRGDASNTRLEQARFARNSSDGERLPSPVWNDRFAPSRDTAHGCELSHWLAVRGAVVQSGKLRKTLPPAGEVVLTCRASRTCD